MTVSAVKINSGEVKSSEELPDFTVTKLRVTKKYVTTEQIQYKLEISNIGAHVENWIHLRFKVSCDGHEYIVSSEYQGSGPIVFGNLYANFDRKLRKHTLTIEVDPPDESHPNGLIEELDETNNIKSVNFYTLLRTKEKNLHAFEFLARFSLLERLLLNLQ